VTEGDQPGLVTFRKQIVGLNASVIERFVFRVRRLIRMREMVNVIVTSSAQLRALNCQFRGLDKPTDVLSFPSFQVGNPHLKSAAGDVVISADIARDNANHLGHSLENEVKILVLHGILHLAGFDHEHDVGEMAREESRLRRRLKLETALIERTEAPSAKIAARKTVAKRRRAAKRRTV
jgi:probable rRNA maturation factor